MAATVGRICGAGLLKSSNGIVKNQINSFSTTREWMKSRKALMTTLGAVTGGVGALIFALDQSVRASDLELHPPKNPFYHKGFFHSLDHASVRRGYEVYKQVCAACHSMKYVAYRDLVGVSHTEEEAKAEAEEVMVTDGPDETGNMYQRPGKLSDYFPSPYPNEEAARAANNGAFPPDLTYITSGRHGEEDYIFALLTGYCDAPAGIQLREGQYYNPYFPGGAISMAQALYSEVIEYADGTPATASQLSKDVSTFLKWTAETEHDQRKIMVMKAIGIFTLAFFVIFYYQRRGWAHTVMRKVQYKPKD